MTLFMTFAACYGVLQLAALGWAGGRTVRIGTLLLAVTAGLYACGVVSIVLQIVYTRGYAALTGMKVYEVVPVAGYTVDPFIEELVKVAPLLVLAMHRRIRAQWGMIDYSLLGSALGAGFGLLEAILRFSHRAATTIALPGGWMVPLGFSATFVPDVGTTLGSWLPSPASSGTLSFLSAPDTYLHLAWSAVAGAGVGILLRGKGLYKLLGVLPIVFTGALHAAVNYDLTALKKSSLGDMLSAPLLAANDSLWLFPLLALGFAAYWDRRDLSRARQRWPELYGSLLEFAVLRPPWTVLITLRYTRLRRSLAFASARMPAAAVTPWLAQIRTIKQLIDRTSLPAAWRAKRRKAPIRLRPLTIVIWLVLTLPSLAYLIVGGFPATAGLQKAMTTPGLTTVLIGLLLAGLAWSLWLLLTVLRALPGALRRQYGDVAARAHLRLLTLIGSLAGGGYALLLSLTGTGLRNPPIRNFHVLAALAGAALFVLFVLALISFPPSSGLLFAMVGSGALEEGIALTAAEWLAVAELGAISGWSLASAADPGGLSSGSGGEGGTEPPARGSRDWRMDPAEQGDPHVHDLGWDYSTKSFRVGEAETAVRVELQEGVELERYTGGGYADWIDPATGLKYDAVGSGLEDQYFETEWEKGQIQKVIEEHAGRVDRVPFDVSRLNPTNIQTIQQFIQENSLGSKVFLVGE